MGRSMISEQRGILNTGAIRAGEVRFGIGGASFGSLEEREQVRASRAHPVDGIREADINVDECGWGR